MLDPSSSEEESEELVEEESGKEPLAPAAARLSPSRPGESPGPGGGGGGGGGLQPGGRAGGAARPASPSPSVASEKEKDELERLQREEEERKRKLQLYVFVMRCIAYPFNAKQPTDMARRQQKVPRCRPALPVLLPLPFAAPCPRRPPAPRLPAPPPARSRSRPRRLPGAPRAVPARGTLAPCGLRVGSVWAPSRCAAPLPPRHRSWLCNMGIGDVRDFGRLEVVERGEIAFMARALSSCERRLRVGAYCEVPFFGS